MPKLSMISTSREYQSLCNMFSSNWKFLIETDIKKMCQHVQSFDEPKYHTDAGRKQIGYQDHDGIDFEKSYGYRTVFAYLSEYEKGNLTQSEVCQYLNMKVSCGQFSYANINPSLILGVTGTVEVLSSYEYSVMTKFNIEVYTTLPSSYGCKKGGGTKEEPKVEPKEEPKVEPCVTRSAHGFLHGPINLKFDHAGDGIKVFQEKDDYFREIAQEINYKSYKNDDTKSLYRAIIVFFENNNRLEEFQRSEYFRRNIFYKSSINILTEETDERTRDVYVSKAATCGQITLTTKYFGRGTDFVSWDEELNQKGGVHVLQTFLSTTESEEVQIKGRSARQGQNGSYGMILLESDDEMLVVTEANGDKVEKHKEDTLARFNISPGDINNMAFNNRYKFLNDKRIEARQEEGREIDESLEKAKERDTLSHEYFDAVVNADKEKAHTKLEELYKTIPANAIVNRQSRTIVLSDATSSMFDIWDATKQYITEMLHRIKELGGKDSLNLFWVAYRDYDCTVLEKSGWLSDASLLQKFVDNIAIEGGEDDEEAVEQALALANEEHDKDPITRVILIADAPPHPESKGQQLADHSVTLSTDYKIETKKLKQKGIPVFTFYLNTDKTLVTPFEYIANQTGGSSALLDDSSKLIDVICTNVLEDIGGSELVAEYHSRWG